jgi:hypothetical protein
MCSIRAIGRGRCLCSEPDAIGDKLFDRTADPYELDNAIARRPGVAGDLRDKLLAMKAKLDARGDAFGAAQSKAVGEETQKALEALGYIKKAMKGDSETQPATNSTTAPQ